MTICLPIKRSVIFEKFNTQIAAENYFFDLIDGCERTQWKYNEYHFIYEKDNKTLFTETTHLTSWREPSVVSVSKGIGTFGISNDIWQYFKHKFDIKGMEFAIFAHNQITKLLNLEFYEPECFLNLN